MRNKRLIINDRDVNTRTGVLNIDAKMKKKIKNETKIINPAGS